MRTARASCTATSSRPTSSWSAARSPRCWTSASRASRTGQRLPALEGVVAGSPHYLAPEQLRGETGRRAHRRLLARRRAVRAADRPQGLRRRVAASRSATRSRSTQPPPPHELRPEVPRGAVGDRDARDGARPGAALSLSARRWRRRCASGSTPQAELGGRRRPHRHAGKRRLIAARAGALGRWRIGGRRRAGSCSARRRRPVARGRSAAQRCRRRTAPPRRRQSRRRSHRGRARPRRATTAPRARTAATAEAAGAVPAAAAPPTPRPQAAAKPRRASRAPARAANAAAAAAPRRATGVVHIAISPWGQVEVDGKPRRHDAAADATDAAGGHAHDHRAQRGLPAATRVTRARSTPTSRWPCDTASDPEEQRRCNA